MKAARIHRFGGPAVIEVEDIPRPSPGPGEVLVRVAAAGVAPWDALIREGKSKVSPPPPLTLGSDLSGVVEAVGPGVSQWEPTRSLRLRPHSWSLQSRSASAVWKPPRSRSWRSPPGKCSLSMGVL